MTQPQVAEIRDLEPDDPMRLAGLDGVRVLAIDDARAAREAITAVLETAGARVLAIASAAEALPALARLRPDVLLVDMAMPGMDGFVFIRRVRSLDAERGGATPAAAVTAYASPTERASALLAGYQAFVAKPFDAGELVGLVARLAGRIADA